MENLLDKILGPVYIMDSKFKDILKEYILDKVTNGNLNEYANNLPEDEQIEILKKYLDKLKNPYNYKDPFILSSKPYLYRDSDISSKLNGGITDEDSKCYDSINMNTCTKK